MALFDAEIRQQPFIYMVEGGRLQLTERERQGSRAYLLGGGFLLIAVLCHNTDLGDGWERIDEDAYYYREFTLKKAYPLGINIVVYALSQ